MQRTQSLDTRHDDGDIEFEDTNDDKQRHGLTFWQRWQLFTHRIRRAICIPTYSSRPLSGRASSAMYNRIEEPHAETIYPDVLAHSITNKEQFTVSHTIAVSFGGHATNIEFDVPSESAMYPIDQPHPFASNPATQVAAHRAYIYFMFRSTKHAVLRESVRLLANSKFREHYESLIEYFDQTIRQENPETYDTDATHASLEVQIGTFDDPICWPDDELTDLSMLFLPIIIYNVNHLVHCVPRIPPQPRSSLRMWVWRTGSSDEEHNELVYQKFTSMYECELARFRVHHTDDTTVKFPIVPTRMIRYSD